MIRGPDDGPEVKRCRQCGTELAARVKREIFDRAFHPRTGKTVLRRRMLIFCSKVCGGHYQMGCEG